MSITFTIAVTVDPIDKADIDTYIRAKNAIYYAMVDAADELRKWIIDDAIQAEDAAGALIFQVEC